jgi:hypothetical protein
MGISFEKQKKKFLSSYPNYNGHFIRKAEKEVFVSTVGLRHRNDFLHLSGIL